jgi:2-methylfumaryl-CoA isomerase
MDLGNATDMLAGLRIVELSSFVAAPSAGLVLRQLGAEVIRIDPSGGGPDIGRWPLSADGQSIYWAGLNRGKQSVTLDFTSPECRDLIGQLVALPGDDSGIVLSNSSGRAWLSDQLLREHRSDLIHVQVLGRSDGSPAVDYTVNAQTGLPLATGSASDVGPVNQVLPSWDLLTGMYAALAIVSAVSARRRDGNGRHLTIALEDVAMATLTTLGFLGEASTTGAPRARIGNYLYGSFGVDVELADGAALMIVALTRRQWSSLVELTETDRVVEALELQLQANFLDEGDRYKHREILSALIRPWFRQRSLGEAAAALANSAVLWAPYRNFLEVVHSLGDEPSPVLGETHDAHLGVLLATTGPIRAPHAPKPELAPAALLGGDTTRVLEYLLNVSPDIDQMTRRQRPVDVTDTTTPSKGGDPR